jgi:hypothetical protein
MNSATPASRARRWAAGAGLLLLAAGAAARGDELVLNNGTSYRGVFQGFENRKFRFLSTDERDIKELPTNVKSLTLDHPVKASILPAVGREMDGVLVKGYEKFALQIERDGEAQTLSLTQVRRVNVDFDFQRVMDTGVARVISEGEEVAIVSSLKTGSVTVVHFHSAATHSSVRQGNYLERLVEKDSAHTAMLRIVVPDWDAPVCRQYGVHSVPQFWFYDAAGALAAKLTERFTEDDIDRALAKARHGAPK